MTSSVKLRVALALISSSLLSFADSSAQQAAQPQDATPTIVVNVNKVLVPVVVRDAQGHAVGNLTKEDFQVFDNDKPQLISRFTIEKRVGGAGSTRSGKESPSSDTGTRPSNAPQRFIVFLFDDLHLTIEDMVHIQKAGTKALASTLVDSDIAAVVSISGRVNSGLTRDHAKLQQAILALKPQGLYRNGGDCPSLDYYQADLIENKHDSGALDDAIRQVFNCNPGMDRQREYDTAQRLAESTAMRVQMTARQDIQITYGTIRELVRRMASLPGQSTLILASPGFLTLESDALTTESQIIDLAAQSNVVISAIDARGLYTTSVNASESVMGSPQARSDYRRNAMELAENPLSELADGTGGTYFHNSNDLDAGLKSLAEPPEYTYLLEFSPGTGNPEPGYHHLKLKVDRAGTQIQARRWYFIPKPPKKKK